MRRPRTALREPNPDCCDRLFRCTSPTSGECRPLCRALLTLLLLGAGATHIVFAAAPLPEPLAPTLYCNAYADYLSGVPTPYGPLASPSDERTQRLLRAAHEPHVVLNVFAAVLMFVGVCPGARRCRIYALVQQALGWAIWSDACVDMGRLSLVPDHYTMATLAEMLVATVLQIVVWSALRREWRGSRPFLGLTDDDFHELGATAKKTDSPKKHVEMLHSVVYLDEDDGDGDANPASKNVPPPP